MSADLIIWKWAETGRPADPKEVREALAEDEPHPALTSFDTLAFVTSLRDGFGFKDDDPAWPFSYDVSDFKDASANWVDLSIGWDQAASVFSRIIDLAHAHGLVVYDCQSGEVQ